MSPQGVFPGGSVIKSPPANAGDTGSILGQEDPMEKEMATHFSILAWEIPWTEDPGRPQSMGLAKPPTRLNMHAHADVGSQGERSGFQSGSELGALERAGSYLETP